MSEAFFVGHGYDVHPLAVSEEEQPLMLGGIAIPSFHQVIAHSDGDVILHALTDALLGTIGAGDIGEHFPPSDAKWKDTKSSLFIQHTLSLLKDQQAQIINVDITFISETPKLNPYKTAIKNHIAHLLSIPLSCVNIKATTTEKLGFLGREEGLAAEVVVSVKRSMT